METLMTPREKAECLRLNSRTVYKLAQAGKIAATKVRGSWKVEIETFDEWLLGQATAMAWQPRGS